MTIKITNQFKKEVKHLLKKYRSLATELKELNVSLVEYPSQGQDCYKNPTGNQEQEKRQKWWCKSDYISQDCAGNSFSALHLRQV